MARNPLGRPPTRAEILDGLSAVELAVGDMMRRSAVAPEVRVELMDIYRPVLVLLLRAKWRG